MDRRKRDKERAENKEKRRRLHDTRHESLHFEKFIQFM